MRLLSLGALTLVAGAVAFTGTAGALALPPAIPGTVINTTVKPTIPKPSLTAPVTVKTPVKAIKKTAVKKKTRVRKH